MPLQFLTKPWRAMLIKDNDGDWAVLSAAWMGMRPGVPGVPGSRYKSPKPGKPGSPGYFKMHYLNLR